MNFFSSGVSYFTFEIKVNKWSKLKYQFKTSINTHKIKKKIVKLKGLLPLTFKF